MTKDDKINLKLEVYKDKNSGKLTLLAHFDKTAPNVFKEKENFVWMPTDEEKNFLNEAFEILPQGTTVPPVKEDTNSKQNTQVEDNDSTKEQTVDEVKDAQVEQTPTEDTVPVDDTLDKSTDTDVTDDYNKTEKDTTADLEVSQKDIDDVMLEDIDKDEVKNLENDQDKAMIVEADADAIDQAIKKHTKNDDETIVEADEQTIIDKVLSQKKKGRWSRK
jgi:hypothetical protein